MKSSNRQWLPFTCCVFVALISFLATRGTVGRFLLFCVGFSVAGVVFVATTLVAHRKPTGEFGLQSVALVATAVAPLLFDNRLQEMGGMLNLFIPLAAMVIVGTATIGLLLKQHWKPG